MLSMKINHLPFFCHTDGIFTVDRGQNESLIKINAIRDKGFREDLSVQVLNSNGDCFNVQQLQDEAKKTN